MSIAGRIVEKMFEGRSNILGNCIARYNTSVSPNGVVTAPKGTLLVMDYNGDAVDGDVYINTDGSTAWTIINNETA